MATITTLSEAYKLKRQYGDKINDTQPRSPEQMDFERLLRDMRQRKKKDASDEKRP